MRSACATNVIVTEVNLSGLVCLIYSVVSHIKNSFYSY